MLTETLNKLVKDLNAWRASVLVAHRTQALAIWEMNKINPSRDWNLLVNTYIDFYITEGIPASDYELDMYRIVSPNRYSWVEYYNADDARPTERQMAICAMKYDFKFEMEQVRSRNESADLA